MRKILFWTVKIWGKLKWILTSLAYEQNSSMLKHRRIQDYILPNGDVLQIYDETKSEQVTTLTHIKVSWKQYFTPRHYLVWKRVRMIFLLKNLPNYLNTPLGNMSDNSCHDCVVCGGFAQFVDGNLRKWPSKLVFGSVKDSKNSE